MAERQAQPVGYAIYFFTYSTFLMRPTLYLEDIFVLPAERRHGIGKALMRRLAEVAIQAGCGRMEWQVLDWNQLARRFYHDLGAQRISEWLPYRLTLSQLTALAHS